MINLQEKKQLPKLLGTFQVQTNSLKRHASKIKKKITNITIYRPKITQNCTFNICARSLKWQTLRNICIWIKNEFLTRPRFFSSGHWRELCILSLLCQTIHLGPPLFCLSMQLFMLQQFMTVCSYHVMYAFQSEPTLYSCPNVKELFARSRCEIWSLTDCNWTRTHYHLVHKRKLNNLAKLAKWLSRIVSTYLHVAFDCMFLSCHVRACFEQGGPWHWGNYRVWIFLKRVHLSEIAKLIGVSFPF